MNTAETAAVVELEQNTTEWKQWRSKKIGASDAPIIMGVSPFATPLQLWLQKTGRAAGFSGNWATERGQLLEPAARSRYELKSDLELPAVTLVHPRYKFLSASLDGYSAEASVCLEIKIAGADVFDMAKGDPAKKIAGKCHPKYYPQVQQQLLVSGAKECHFFVCKAETKNGQHTIVDDALVVVTPDPEFQKDMLVTLLGFWNCMQSDTPPPLTDRDYMELDDQSSLFLFSDYKNKKLELAAKEQQLAELADSIKLLEVQLDELREQAIEEVEVHNHPRIECCGVRMSKNKNGSWAIRLAAEGDE